MNGKRRWLLPLAVGALTGLWLVSLLFAARTAGQSMDRLERRAAQVAALRDLTDGTLARLEDLRTRATGEAEPLARLAASWESAGGAAVEVSSEEVRELADGFRYRRAEVMVRDISPDALPGLLAELQRGTPAWQLRDLQLRLEGESLRGTLRMSVLERPGS